MTKVKKRLLMTTPMTKQAEKAKEENFYLIALMKKAANLVNISNYADELYIFDINNTKKLDSFIQNIHEQEPLDFIYHLGHDELMEPAYQIAEKHGLSLNSLESINIINDKYKMREMLTKHGISTVRYKKALNISEISGIVKTFGYPLILKPTNLSGSRGVTLCKDYHDVVEWENLMEKHKYLGPFLVEEYLEGSEVSVEALTFEGKHEIIGLTDKIKTPLPLFVELGHVHPSQLPIDIQEEVKNTVIDFLNLTNYQFGPTHTELIITKEGPKIIESHTRLAGDRIPVLVEAATGICMEEAIFKLLNSKKVSFAKKDEVAMIKYFQWEKGEIEDIKGLEIIEKTPDVLMFESTLKAGDMVPDIVDSDSRYGYIIVKGETYEKVSKRMQEIMQMVKVKIKDSI
ncbi:ATP-grasp domain-containing protein [Bacillus sp. FSL W7-1334]|uniref:ATP-grasp domain-containing protein n=1 Tax=Bacillus sp. FSL W7-1334 TaxID=2921703 RepID=UPI0030F691A0|nr:ATP-grasp domain-containing protein [Bacillus cereus]